LQRLEGGVLLVLSVLVLAAVGLIGGASFAVDVALIWIGHIGVDRMLAYGLKLPTAFQDTHLGRIGRSR
jgi:Domain of unknown function (DUF4260)